MLEAITAAVPLKYRPFAKSMVPAVTGLVAVIASGLSSGFDLAEVNVAAGAVLTAVITFYVPNAKAPA